jgi:hypothetical protein
MQYPHIYNNVKCKLIILFLSILVVNLGWAIEGTNETPQIFEII